MKLCSFPTHHSLNPLYKSPTTPKALMPLRQRRTHRVDTAADLSEITPEIATSDCTVWWPLLRAPPSNALTDNEEAIWNAGRFAPASIRFEFAAPVRCTRIELLPCMSPETGPVLHEIRTASDVYRYAGRATDRQWISAELNGQKVKTIEVVTLQSPSWVAWRRVRFWIQGKKAEQEEEPYPSPHTTAHTARPTPHSWP